MKAVTAIARLVARVLLLSRAFRLVSAPVRLVVGLLPGTGQAILAIARQTIRASVRSRVFHLLFFLMLLAVFLLPLTVKGDGTAKALVQVSLTYSLSVITALVSAATLWLGCSVLSREIESYQLHMVVVKPVGRWAVWVGKWLGVFAMQAFLFIISAAIVYGLVRWRVYRADFAEEEMRVVNREILTGRRTYEPFPPPIEKIFKQAYAELQAQGRAGTGPEESINRSQLLRQIKARSTEIPYQSTKVWRYPKFKVRSPDSMVHVRYRIYTGSTSRTTQKRAEGIWMLFDATQLGENGSVTPLAQLAQQVLGGVYHEFWFPATLLPESGELALAYANDNQQQQPVIFQLGDGPSIMIPVTSFGANYLRVVFLILLQIAFLAALGCVSSGLFSTPVAVFVGAGYLALGTLANAYLADIGPEEDGKYPAKGFLQKFAYVVAQGTDAVVVSVKDFNTTYMLNNGRLVEGRYMARTMATMVLLRGLPLSLLGIALLMRRELGTVVRR